MKTLFAFIAFLVLVLGCRAASPSYQSFDPAGFKITPTGIIELNTNTIAAIAALVGGPTNGLSSNQVWKAISDFTQTNTPDVSSNMASALIAQIPSFSPANSNSLLSWAFTASTNFYNLNRNAFVIYPDGTTNQYNAIMAAFRYAISNNGGNIYFAPGDFYTSTNLTLTNGLHLYGGGLATIHFTVGSSAATNALMDTGTNGVNKNISIDGLNFRGTANNYSGGAGSYVFNKATGFDPSFQIALVNQHGLRFNSAIGGEIKNCSFAQFPGYGMIILNSDGTGESFQSRKVTIINNLCYSNYIGAMFTAAQNMFQGVFNPDPSTYADFECTYQQVLDNQFFRNALGACMGGGNMLVECNEFTQNDVGLMVRRGGQIIGNTFNHCASIALLCTSTAGAQIIGNAFLAEPELYFDNDTFATFSQNYLGGTALKLTCTNWASGILNFQNNQYLGIWGTDVVTNLSGGTAPTNVVIFGNTSTTIMGDTDGNPMTLLYLSRVVATNIANSGPLTVGGPATFTNSIFARSNTAPFTLTSTTTGTAFTITNGPSRGFVVLKLAFDDANGGAPSCTIIATNQISTNNLGTLAPLNAFGITLLAAGSITNDYTYPVDTNQIVKVTDTSSGAGAAVRLIKSTLINF